MPGEGALVSLLHAAFCLRDSRFYLVPDVEVHWVRILCGGPQILFWPNIPPPDTPHFTPSSGADIGGAVVTSGPLPLFTVVQNDPAI